MRMSHIYQPVMLIELLKNGGISSCRKIAKSLLNEDESQIEYYEKITKNMVGKVLTINRKITEKKDDEYLLTNFRDLSKKEVKELIELCKSKIDDFTKKRGEGIWEHRKLSSGYISGSIKYEVLKRAKFRCELCGIPAKDRALEVDHIIPKSKGGSDDISNFQALCYSCNSSKRNRDDTDFRNILSDYDIREKDCIFCNVSQKKIIDENELCIAIYDSYPVTKGHTLIIPKRHVSDYFELYQPELNSIQQLLHRQKELLISKDKLITGFNVGINSGEDAGQTVFHCHVHLIPRRKGDVKKPKGGVRGVIPNKQDY